MKKSSRIASVLGIAAIAASLAACTPAATTPEKTTLTLGLGGWIHSSFDPTTSDLLGQMVQAVYEPLITLNQTTNEYEPWLAEEYTLSEDRRTVSFRLRDDVDYTDGTHMTANTVKESWDARLAVPDTFYRALINETYGTEVMVIGEYEIEFVTHKRSIDYDFLKFIRQHPIVSPAAMADPAALDNNPIGGTGPYLLVERVPGV